MLCLMSLRMCLRVECFPELSGYVIYSRALDVIIYIFQTLWRCNVVFWLFSFCYIQLLEKKNIYREVNLVTREFSQ